MELNYTRYTLQFIMRVSLVYLILLTGTLQVLSAASGLGQSLAQIQVTMQAKEATLIAVLQQIEQQTDLLFAYPEDVRQYKGITLPATRQSVKGILETAFKDTPFTYRRKDNNVIIYVVEQVSEQIRKGYISMMMQVSGKVTATDGDPLPGVNVVEKGTTNGTVTDIDGNYSLDVAEDATLVFSFIGYKTQEVAVNGRRLINIYIEENISQLNEITINGGYYKTSKREATGNISQVTAKAIEQQPVSNPLAALQGRMSGVNITQSTGMPGGGFNIQIRGRNSIRPDGNEPLFIIDGIPFSNETLGQLGITGSIFPIVTSPNGNTKTGSTSALNSINPENIESVEILKDADATAIYGSKGANGVVLITTKKGKAGKTKFDIKINSGINSVARTLDLMNTAEYLEMRYEAFANDGINDVTTIYAPDLNDYDQDHYSDWQNVFYGNKSYSNDIQASVSGGSGDTEFLFSTGYHNESTVVIGDGDYQKLSGMMNINHQSENNKFKASLSIKYGLDKNNLINNGFNIFIPPNSPSLYNDDGEINWGWNNPIGSLENRYSAKTNSLINNALLEFKLAPELWFTTNLGFSRTGIKEIGINPSTAYNPAFGIGSESSLIYFNNGTREVWNVEPQINWGVNLGNGRFTLLVGTTFREEKGESVFQIAYGFPNNSMITNIGAASNVFLINNSDNEYRYNSIYGRINYNFNRKYIVNVTGRRDGSTRFGPGKQFANFGAIGAAWIFSEESFLKENSLLSYGKLRGSYGITGNDQYGDYQFLDTYSTTSSNYNGIKGLTPTQLFNSNLAWEINKKLEFGLELGFFKDHILLSANYYHNRSSNQLIEFPLSGVTGFTSITSNFDATVQNTGLEVELNTINFQNQTFNWNTGFNITFAKNKLVSFSGLEKSAAYKDKLVIGQPLNIQKAYEFTGVDVQTGLYTVKDVNEDGNISFVDDAKIIKLSDPQFYGGLSNNITYKNFELDFLLQFVKQIGKNINGFPAGGLQNAPSKFLDRWQKPGDISSFQRYTAGLDPEASTAFNYYERSSGTYSDASFIRLKNISLSYHLPDKWTKGFTARLYLQGQNILTFTNYFGLDPESQSVTYLPPLKNITFGAQFIF